MGSTGPDSTSVTAMQRTGERLTDVNRERSMCPEITYGIARCTMCGNMCAIRIRADDEIEALGRRPGCKRCGGRTFRQIFPPNK